MAMNLSGFCDLNFSIAPTNDNFMPSLYKLVELGYRVAAVNYYVNVTTDFSSGKKKKKAKRSDIIPDPVNITLPEDLKRKLTLFNRLTVAFSESSQLQPVFRSAIMKKYDLLAVEPGSLPCFQYACSAKEVDVISFNPENAVMFKMNRKNYNMAVQRGGYFELKYGPAIIDSTARKNIIQAAHMYHCIGKSLNIIVTSGALLPVQLRGPYDVVNLYPFSFVIYPGLCETTRDIIIGGLIFGLNDIQSKDAVTVNCRKLLLIASNKKWKTAISVVQATDSDEERISKKLKVEDAQMEVAPSENTNICVN